MKYVGEDNVLWGTDSIFYGAPQDQIQAFRRFSISEEFQEKYGYPEMTDAIRAKVFGLNSIRAYGLDHGEFTKNRLMMPSAGQKQTTWAARIPRSGLMGRVPAGNC